MKDRINAMSDFIHHHLDHVLFVLLLISQIGYIGTTYIAKPNLKLTDNPLILKFRWPFVALVSILIPFIACLNNRVALMLFVFFLLVSASNASKMWMMRVLGEEEYLQLYSNFIETASRRCRHSSRFMSAPHRLQPFQLRFSFSAMA
jgi:hypothetical protein